MEEKRENYAIDFLSIFLILFTPFFIFVERNNFLFEFTNLFICLFLAAIAGIFSLLFRLVPSILFRVFVLAILLLLFIDIQFDWLQVWGAKIVLTGMALFLILWVLHTHASKILVVVFGMTTAVSLGSSFLSYATQYIESAGSGSDSRNTRLPLYVHIILDEHIGLEGFDNEIPSHKEIKNELGNFFTENEFRIFSRAYSPYYDSKDSLSSSMNFEASDDVGKFYSSEKNSYFTMSKNTYFEKLLAMDYTINVYQSTYMDFCSSLRNRIQNCTTYDFDGFSPAALTGLTEYEKTALVASAYGRLSMLVITARILYREFLRYLKGQHVSPPGWIPWSNMMGPIPALPVFDKLIKDVSTAPGGTMFFAHLLIPHYPYSVDSACAIRHPVLEWNNSFIGDKNSGKLNSSHSRLAHYKEYISQVRCALLKLKELVRVLKKRNAFEDAIIIVHGDHGSRIALVEPRMEYKDRLSRQDFFDAFSTLFAVKVPGVAPGYDSRMVALADLLRNTMPGDQGPLKRFTPDTRPTVFLRYYTETDKNSGLHEFAMPDLPTSDR